MDFLSKRDDDAQQKEQIECLERKRLKLNKQLQNIENELNAYNTDIDTPVRYQTTTTIQSLQIIDAYRYLGVSIKYPSVKDDSIIFKFDPLYKGQAPCTDSSFYAEIKMTNEGHRLGQHNLPPFLPVKQMETTHLAAGNTKEFVQEIQNYLQCYIQRCESTKQVKIEYQDRGIIKVEADLPVTHVKFTLSINKAWPNIIITFNYDLSKITPKMVTVEMDDTVTFHGREKDKLNKMLSQWRNKFIQKDLYTAFTDVFKDI